MNRFPEKQEVINTALLVFTLVNFWSLIVFLYNFPGLIKQLALVEIFSVLGYILFSAFFESLVIFVILVGLSFLLPAKLLRSGFSVKSAIVLFLSTLYIIPFHVNIPRFSTLKFEAGVSMFIALWTALFIIVLVLLHLIVPKYPNFTTKTRNFIDRLTVLGAIYLIFDLIAVVFVISASWN